MSMALAKSINLNVQLTAYAENCQKNYLADLACKSLDIYYDS